MFFLLFKAAAVGVNFEALESNLLKHQDLKNAGKMEH